MKSVSRVALVLAAAGILAMSAAAILISPPVDACRGAGLSPADVVAEYQREARSLQARGLVLPPGRHWPKRGPALDTVGPDGASMTYEKGYGAVAADRYWFYSWASRAVAVSGSASRRHAIDQLQRVRETLLYQKRLPEDRAYMDQLLQRAARGDLTLLREYVKANAPAIQQ